MGTWGVGTFENDTACDWLGDFCDGSDLALIETTFEELESVGVGYLDQDLACNALGACEVLASLRGRPGTNDAFTEKLFDWVASHPLRPGAEMQRRALDAIARIMGKDSELRELWQEGEDFANWTASIEELRSRLRP